MKVDADRSSSDPLEVKGGFEFDEADLTAAFLNQTDPDEDLAYELFLAWDQKKASERLHILARVAELVEGSPQPAQATNETVTAEPLGEPA